MRFRSIVNVNRNWGIGISVLFILAFAADTVSAQNVSITDYEVPVSSADRLLIDFSADHATKGSDVTASKVAAGGLYKRFSSGNTAPPGEHDYRRHDQHHTECPYNPAQNVQCHVRFDLQHTGKNKGIGWKTGNIQDG